MTELLVNVFSEVFVHGVPAYVIEHQVYDGVFGDVDLSLAVVAGLLSCFNGSSAAGPDGLHPHMLKACSDSLSLTLYFLFVRSFHEGVLSTLWKPSSKSFVQEWKQM